MKKLIKENEEISGVTLVFENCEIMNIPYKDLIWLQVKNITQDVVFNGIAKQTSCNLLAESLLLGIKNSFLKEYSRDEFWFDEEMTTKDRLKENDITSISLIVNKKGVVEKKLENLGKPDLNTISKTILEQGKTIDIYVPWEDSDDYVNFYQKCEEGTDGFIINIDKENLNEKD